jgi:hypothetical protein
VSARKVVNVDDSDDEDWRPGYQSHEEEEERKEQQSGWKKSKVKLSVTTSSQESAACAASFVAHSCASQPAMSDAPTQIDDTQSSMPPLVPYTAAGAGASAGAGAGGSARSKPTKRTIQPTLLSSPAAAATAVPTDALFVGSQGAFVPFSGASALAPSTAIKSSAHVALLSSAGVRGAGKGKRKRATEASDTIGAMLMQQQEESKHSVDTIVLDDDDDEGDSMPPLSSAVAAASSRPRRAASRLVSSRLVASSTVPLLERRAATAFDEDEDEDEDDDWRDEEEEQEERKQPTPARRKSKATTKKSLALASPTSSDFSAASSPSRSRSGASAASSPTRRAAAAAAAASSAASPPPVPFIFNPAHLPSDDALAASDQEVGQRFQRMLADTQPVGTTTARQRASMPKDLLLQRNLEIQCQSHSIRRQGASSLESKLTFVCSQLCALYALPLSDATFTGCSIRALVARKARRLGALRGRFGCADGRAGGGKRRARDPAV